MHNYTSINEYLDNYTGINEYLGSFACKNEQITTSNLTLHSGVRNVLVIEKVSVIVIISRSQWSPSACTGRPGIYH